jgi:hypothetical protein
MIATYVWTSDDEMLWLREDDHDEHTRARLAETQRGLLKK